MKKNSVILIFVEGHSDYLALNLISKFCKNKNVNVKITNGDITSDFKTTYTNCISVVTDYIKKFMKDYSLKRSDILQVIHIVDTDGAFIPDKNIIQDLNATDTVYELNCIKTNNINKIKSRNDKKSAVINVLCKTDNIYRINYKMYYMSCNLDHVIHNEINLDDREKSRRALKFREIFSDDEQGFIDFFNSKDFKVNMNYNDSWDFIKRNINSLNRYSNVFLFINEILK